VPRPADVLVTLSPCSTVSPGAHVDWADSKGLNQWERKALELSEERSKLGYGISTVEDRQGDEHDHT
jgi:hypothetical protein